MPNPARILLVRLSHLGDVVQTLPLFHGLRERYPDARIAWAIQPEFEPLVASLPGLDRTFLFGRRDGLRAWTRLRSELLSWGPDWAIDAQGNTKSAFVTLVSGAARRSGLARRDWTERFASHVLTDECRPAAGPHGVERVLALLEHAAPGARARFDPALDELELALGRELMAERLPGGAEGAPGFLLNVASPDDVRSWPPSSFAELARRLAREGARVLLLSGPREEDVGSELAVELSSTPNIAHWVGQRGLRHLAAFFRAAAEKGLVLVACDSGPAHLAASVELPVALLAGPQDPRRTGPWPPPSPPSMEDSNPHRTLTAPVPPPCAPCFARRCTHHEGPVCLTRIDPEQVVRELLSRTPPP